MQMASLKHIAYTHKSNMLLKENMVPLQTLAYKYNLKNLGYMRQRKKKDLDYSSLKRATTSITFSIPNYIMTDRKPLEL
jgi:hypothetical protein